MTKREKDFHEEVMYYYKKHGRALPWRSVTDPYNILVSEIMLQQTQVERVIPKYKRFLQKFKTLHALADAPLADVLREWQGLGYNRRAKMLHTCARVVRDQYGGVLPQSYEALKSFPGIGPYTAGAVMNFAYNTPMPMIETNIRTVYLHHFFKNKENVTDKEIIRLIEQDLNQKKIRKNPREWYAALMDYGTHLKKTIGNQNTRSRHYTKQTTFKGSDREIRGALLRSLATNAQTTRKLCKDLTHDPVRIKEQLNALTKEGFIALSQRKWQLQE